ncbi:HAMP domain-containing protein [Ferrovibrio terrae]|uniref:histidine kinase n=1 Tax=Ferrovibrio terrae TaxID=2594003 RepID=A0A516H2X0_9PROT|nr:ATP-binding protein [Ferrovibrio terrae]QDO98124.1 HAMP domain-containing protein [Ferrovibrio terrae]
MTVFKRLLPRSLFGRWLVLLVAPVVVLQALLTYIFYERHWDAVTRRLGLGLAGEISVVIATRENNSDPAVLADLMWQMDRALEIDITFEPDRDFPANIPAPRRYSILDRMLAQALSERVSQPYMIDTQRNDRTVVIYVKLPDALMTVTAPENRIFSTSTYAFVLWMAAASVVLLGIAVLFLRNQIKPIRRLAEAADAFGKGRDIADFRPAGAEEVRAASRAFLAMRDRIRRHIRERTEMLAGVSHDLRTPLTRMKLQLSMMPADPEVDELKRDIDEMEKMVGAYLAFARGQSEQPAEPTDLGNLIAELADDVRRRGRELQIDIESNLTLPLRRLSFKRALSNLIENGLRFGRRVQLSVTRMANRVEIRIEDDGPGLPEKERHKVFRPFYRLDQARHGSGNVGLGLTIARDAVLAHGGEIALGQSPMGGLMVTIRLPV